MANVPGFKEMAAPAPSAKLTAQSGNRREFLTKLPEIERFHRY
jgi:hypothetical protein